MPHVPSDRLTDYTIDDWGDSTAEDPNYECQECGYLEDIDEYQLHTPYWCDSCDDMKTFKKL